MAGSAAPPPLGKLLMLAPASVVHTRRWAEALAARGIEVVLATQHPDPAWRLPAGLRVVSLPHTGTAGYFLNVPALRRLLRAEQPALLNAHYASGYGTTAALAGFRPWLLSVWGSDVYDLPYEGRLKGWWLRRNLRQADAIASTSEAMARQVRRLLPGPMELAVTPFGIDTARFAPQPVGRGEGPLVIGTVKTLAPKYGIDVLLRAFARLQAAGPRALSLLIVGGGPQRAELEALARALGIDAQVRFAGPVPHAEVPHWLHQMDIYVAASRLDSESFGVAVLEASACALPVVVSDVGGLPEVVSHGVTGLVVPRDDPAALAAALERLVAEADLRRAFGEAGRARVQQQYEWTHSVDEMLACFNAVRTRFQSSALGPQP
jgi:L-malate glycosyltransferase